MTTAGTITVGVDIDANGLGPKLAAAVRAQLAPMLADINKQLGKIDPGGLESVSRAAGEAAKSAEQTAKSTDKATAAVKRQKTAVDDLEKSTRLVKRTQDDYNAAVDIFGKKSPQAETALKRLAKAQDAHTDVLVRSAAASKSSTDSQIQDIERLTRAAEDSARRHAALSKMLTSAAPGGGSGGGGGRQGFLVPGLLGGAGLAASGLPAATLVVTNLVGAVQQLAQTGLALPGVFAGIAASVGTAKLGFMGMGDALTEMFKAAKSGDPKDIKKAAEALKDLSPAAKETVTSIAGLVPEFDKVRKDIVQQNMFDGIGKSITDFSGKMLPTFKTGLGGIATAWNGTFKSLLGAASSDSSKSFLDRIFGNTADAQNRANKAIEPIIHGLGQLATTGSNFLPRLADGLTAVSTRFDNFISKAAADGRLDKWIDQGFKAVGSLGESFLNVGKIITSLTQAAGGDGGFFKMLETGTGKLATFLGSEEGQQKLTRFFADARQRLSEWIPILGDVARVIGDVFKGLQQWGDVLLPVVGGITHALSEMPGFVSAAVASFAAFKTLSWLGGLATSLTGINAALGVAGAAGGPGKGGPGAAGGFLAGGGGVVGLLQKMALGGILAYGANAAAGDLLKAGPGEQPSSLAQFGSGAVDVLGTAAGGALIGSVAGPWGAAIGGAVGALVGGVQAFVSQINTAGDALNSLPDKFKADAAKNPILPKSSGISLQPLDIIPPPNQINEFTPPPTLQDWTVIGPDGKPVANMIPGPDGQLIPNPNKFQQGTPRGMLPPIVPQGRNADKYTVQDNSGNENPFTAGLVPPGFAAGPNGLQPAQQAVGDLSKAIGEIPPAKIDVQAPDLPKAQSDLKGMQGQIDGINKTPISVKADTAAAEQSIRSLFASYQGKTITVPVVTSMPGGPVPGSAPLGPPRADGGVLPGYSPGVDNMLVPMSGGEGVVIPEAMRALGGSWLYRVNSAFRGGLSRRGYATGGVVGADGALGVPDNGVIGLLTQIRDALVGRGSSALATTADNTTQMAQALGPKAKPFGGDVGKGALAGMIKALGGDPNQMDWGGFNGDGQLLVPKGTGAGGQFLAGGGGNLPALAAALSAFARSGNTSDLAGSGLNVNSPVVTAITSARNKRKGMGDDDIAGLVQQVLTGGGYSGVLDSTNTPLVKSLTKFQQQQFTGRAVMPTAGGFDAALLSQVPAGQYSQTGAADLTKGLADCSSSVEDLVNLMDGMPTGGREMSTGNAAPWLTARGFVPGAMPGAFNVGFNGGHMQATLPDGTPFNWGSSAAAARGGVGGTGAFDPSFTQQFYRPVTGMPLGAGGGFGANPLGYSGGPVPVYIVGGPGGNGPFGKIGGQLFGDALSAAGGPAADAAGSIITGIDQGTQLERNSTKNLPAVRTGTLMKEGNPLSVASLAGYQVPDFTRQGWNGQVMGNSGPGFTAGGQMMSDTAALIMRTFTDTQAAADARQQQMLAVLDQIKTQLSEQVLKPIIQSAVQSAMAAAGQAAQQGTSGGGGVIPGLADGGAIWGGVAGKDSVPLLGMPGEHMLTTQDVARMGGQSGVYAFRAALHRNGGMRGFAGGGGIGNDTVGADFFGVSQVPIIGDLINLLMKILLKVIGVDIQVRDTMNRMSDDFRQFRGDFKAFEASGRLMNDTSGLVDRSGSSEETVVAERVRIFKQVLEGLIKFIIQKIVIPITQAIASTLLNAGASAAGGAVSGGLAVTPAAPAAGIAGSLVSSLISSGGQAGINIGGEFAQMIAGAATGPIVGLLTDGFMGIFGKLLNPILTGGIGGLLSAFFPFLAFDEGGLANGMGMLPKATVEPERVLSPRQTSLFEEMVRANFGANAGSSKSVTVEGGIHLHGAQATPEAVRDSVMALLD